MVFILSLSGGEANHFVKDKKTTLTGKERLYLEAQEMILLGEGEQSVCLNIHK